MTYNVFGGMLSLTQSINQSVLFLLLPWHTPVLHRGAISLITESAPLLDEDEVYQYVISLDNN